MKVLHLTLKKKWFDMILSGEKKEEYREIKEYWWMRLVQCGETCKPYPAPFEVLPPQEWKMIMPKEYDTVIFKNGYSKNAPEMEVELKEIKIGVPIAEWTDDDYLKNYFTLSLGKILSTKNIKPIY